MPSKTQSGRNPGTFSGRMFGLYVRITATFDVFRPVQQLQFLGGLLAFIRPENSGRNNSDWPTEKRKPLSRHATRTAAFFVSWPEQE